MTDQTYSSRKTAVAGAKRALTKLGVQSPLSDVHFIVEQLLTTGAFTWTRIDMASGRKEGAPEPITIEAEPKEDGKAAVRAARAKEAIEATPDAPVPVAQKSERWRKPKTVAPSKTAYLPREGSLQEKVYKALTLDGGTTPEALCALVVENGGSAKSWQAHLAWNEVKYLLVSVRGYGLQFNGTHLELLVPKNEKPASSHQG